MTLYQMKLKIVAGKLINYKTVEINQVINC